MGAVCLVLGIVGMAQYRSLRKTPEQAFIEGKTATDLASDSIELYRRHRDLRNRNNELTDSLRILELAQTNDSLAAIMIQQDTRSAQAKAGLTELSGEGIRIQLPADSTVSGNMLCQMINELKAGSAQAIAINAERVVATTEVRETVTGFSVNGRHIQRSEEITILAIGPRMDIYNSINMIGGILDKWEEQAIEVRVDIETNLTIPPLRDGEDLSRDILNYIVKDKPDTYTGG